MLCHACDRVQCHRGVAERRGQIDPGHVATEPRGDPPRRTADTGADVQDAFARLRLQHRRHLARRNHAATVEMVERCEHIGSDRCVGAIHLAQRGQDAGHDIRIGVMILDAATHRHSPYARRTLQKNGAWLDSMSFRSAR